MIWTTQSSRVKPKQTFHNKMYKIVNLYEYYNYGQAKHFMLHRHLYENNKNQQ